MERKGASGACGIHLYLCASSYPADLLVLQAEQSLGLAVHFGS
jgi:hypothetical protein